MCWKTKRAVPYLTMCKKIEYGSNGLKIIDRFDPTRKILLIKIKVEVKTMKEMWEL
jgi:hypothetical protein